MNQKIKTTLTALAIYAASIFLAIILAPLGGVFHNYFWAYQGCWFWGACDQGSTTEGFIYFYIFWLTIFAFPLLRQKMAWIVFIIGSSLFWILSVLFIYIDWGSTNINEDIGSLIIMICMFAAGWLVAQGSLIVYKKLKK